MEREAPERAADPNASRLFSMNSSHSPWINGMPSPYYTKKSHVVLREFVRSWAEENVPGEVGAEYDRSTCSRGREAACVPFRCHECSSFSPLPDGWLRLYTEGVAAPELFEKFAKEGFLIPFAVSRFLLVIDEGKHDGIQFAHPLSCPHLTSSVSRSPRNSTRWPAGCVCLAECLRKSGTTSTT